MPSGTRELGTAILGGLVSTGVLTVILEMIGIADLISIYFFAVGAFVGGLVAAYLLYGRATQGALAGAISGILGTFLYLGISDTLVIFGIVPLPSGPGPDLSQVQAVLTIIMMMDLLAGTVGGAILSAVRHPPRELPAPPPPPPTGSAAAEKVRYCVQCGAQLPSGGMICPHCNAKQPQ